MMTATYDEVLISMGLEPSEKPSTRGCGTHASYVAHLNRGEEPCDACREANRVYKRDRYHAPKPAGTLPQFKHGTEQGARRHRYRREPLCEACRIADRLRQAAAGRKARRARRAAASGGGR